MVRGSGSHNRQNTSNSSNNRGSRNSARTSTGSNTATRGSGRRTAAVAPEPSPPGRSSNREGSSRESVRSQRANRGSGTKTSNESNRTTGTSRSSTSTAPTRESQRSNHGSGTKSSSSMNTSSSFSAARETNRANHGSGTRASNESTRTSRNGTSTTTTRGSQRSNHGSRGGTTTRSSVGPTATTSSATGTHYQRANRGSGTRNSTSTIRTENLSANRGSGTRNNGSSLSRCCRCLCDIVTGIVLALFGVVGTILCCKLCRKGPPNDDNSDPAVNHPNRRRSGLRNCLCEIEEQMCFSPLWSVFGGMLFSILLFLILIQNSAMTNLVSIDSYGDIRTMFAGETLSVYLPILTRSINVEVINDPPTSRGMRAAVYQSKKSYCPSLTGPRLEFQHDSELDLKGDSFVYDYYNLNPGSSVSMVMDQINDGGTYFYLLPGAKALEEIQTGENVDPNHWERIAVAMAHTVGSGSTDSAFMKTPTNVYNYDNIYTLVYDNQSTHRVSSVDVQTDIVMTTHDLHGYNPKCDHMGIGDGCHVYATRSDCIILEAFAVQEEDKEDEEDLQEETAADPTISLRIATFRDWKSIAIYSSIPLAISVLIIGGMYLWGCMIYCCCCRKRNETMIDENATEPLLSPDANGLEEDGSGAAAADLPPPIAPPFVEPPPVESTAPLDSTVTEQQKQDNVVVIPPESVQVV